MSTVDVLVLAWVSTLLITCRTSMIFARRVKTCGRKMSMIRANVDSLSIGGWDEEENKL